jgi:8-oxo-dGTP pyrophosphatase MutT (NUDIX family)
MNDKIVGSGALLYSLDTKRFLFLLRANGKTANTWGLVGGGTEQGETPFEGLQREIQEEIGSTTKIIKTMPLETFVSHDSKFNFHTYLIVVKNEFMPTLNDEHDGFAWVGFGKWPKPLHQGLRNTLQNKTNLAKLETVFQVIDILEE